MRSEIEPQRCLVATQRLDIGYRIEFGAVAGAVRLAVRPHLANLELRQFGALRGFERGPIVMTDPRGPFDRLQRWKAIQRALDQSLEIDPRYRSRPAEQAL